MNIRTIIEDTIQKRLLLNNENDTIQLSLLFFNKFIDEMSNITGIVMNKNSEQDEMKYHYYGRIYLIKHRAFRDNTNDEDFEKMLYETLIKM